MDRHYGKKLSTREKLDSMNQINIRNEQRCKDFAEMKVEQEEKYMRLVDLYTHGEISKDAFFRYLRKLRANEETEQITEQPNKK